MVKNDDKIRLLPANGSAKKNYDSITPLSTEVISDSNHTKTPTNYGSVRYNRCGEKLSYTWTNIDVFGEAQNVKISSEMGVSYSSTFLSRMKSCFDRDYQHIPRPRKHLLKNVSGVAFAGEILAVMGSSGAGKTTLLNSLAFRSPAGVSVSHSAVRALNGIPVNAKQLRSRCAYIQQDDLFIGSLTAREHLIFQALLRLDRRMPYKEKMQKVDQVIADLSLTKCQNTIIGVTGRIKGLSGGERKRLSFASEALTDPNLLLCDEPTSGLDSFMAHNVLQVLKNLAEKDKTIILTIHQPSSEIFGMFDKLLLMANGRVAFLGTPNESNDFFASLQAPCPTNYNPADFFVERLAVVPGKEDESHDTIRKICDAFAVSEYQTKINDEINKLQSNSNALKWTNGSNGNGVEGYRVSWWAQFRAILWRSWLTVLKEPLLVRVRLLQTVLVALVVGVIFYGQELTQDGVMNINGAIFLFLTNMTFQNVFSVANVFCAELPVFLREHRSRLYRTDAYFLGKSLSEFPLFMLVPVIFTSIAYPMIGLRPTYTNFAIALAIVVLVANVSTSFGYLISCCSSSISMALSIGPPLIIPFLLFGGFFLNSGSVPVYFKWLSYLSWFRYGNEALLINQWGDVGPGEIKCNRLNATCPADGRVVLQILNFDVNDFVYDFIGLAALIIGFRFFAFIALVFRARSKE
ncbi:protein white [Contarinia nasturtii]|uniref:protein white n=1 Tax=Contarinia nasturtii TaxID=265458 RepID=UPI0012D447BA|nr:protein white [Contarinia nasturtii]